MEVDLEELIRQLNHLRAYVENGFASLNAEMANLHSIVAEMDETARKKAKKEFTRKIELERMKYDFWNSRPHDRTDPFTDWELVFWASYLLSTTPRREILESQAEVAKRAHKIRGLVQHFTNLISGDNPEEKEKRARIRVKDFLEYVLLGVEIVGKDGKKSGMTFYQAVSPWAINNYAHKVATWQREKNLAKYDKPPEDD